MAIYRSGLWRCCSCQRCLLRSRDVGGELPTRLPVLPGGSDRHCLLRSREVGGELPQLPAQPGVWGRAAAATDAASALPGCWGASCRSYRCGLRRCREVGGELPQLPGWLGLAAGVAWLLAIM